MAGFGAKYPCFAPLTAEADTGNTYGDGIVIGKLVQGDFTPEVAEGVLYADDYEAESLYEITGGTLALQTDSLDDDVAKAIFNCDVATSGEVTWSKNDVIPFGGVGFYQVLYRNNTKYYRAYFYRKCKGQIGNNSVQTFNGSIQFTTENLTFSIKVPLDAKWRQSEVFSSEADAISWVNTKCNITSPTPPGPDPEET